MNDHAFPFARGFVSTPEGVAVNGVLLEDVAKRYGTPLYVYNLDAMVEAWREWTAAFGAIPHMVCYAVKANPNLAVLQGLKNAGSGFEVNSGGELFRALTVGADPSTVVMSGVGKRFNEIVGTIEAGVALISVDSLEECRRVSEAAAGVSRDVDILLRVNPEVDARTHPYIATGMKGHKFGLGPDEAIRAVKEAANLPSLRVVGFGMHIGSQILEVEPYREAVSNLLEVANVARPFLRTEPKYLDIGGGLGVPYAEGDTEVTPSQLLEPLRDTLAASGMTVIAEPGRSITARAGVLVAKVEYVKRTREKTFVILDAGMNDLLRPMLYRVSHTILPCRNPHAPAQDPVDIVGPVCETADTFAEGVAFPKVKEKDFVVIFTTGAYGFTMSSRYNSRRLPAEVGIVGNDMHLVRRRDFYEDLVGAERMLDL